MYEHLIALAAQHGPFGQSAFYFTSKECEVLIVAVIIVIILSMLGIKNKTRSS